MRTSCKDQVHAILAKLGIPVTCSGIFGVWGSTWLDGLALPQPFAGKMVSLRKACALLADEIALLDTAIAALLAHHRGYPAVRVLPGIGPVLGAVIVAEIGGVTRFPRPAELCSWAGLTPRHRESDVKVNRGHITKQGSRILRWALIEAIQHIPAGHPLRQRKDDIIASRIRGSGLASPAPRRGHSRLAEMRHRVGRRSLPARGLVRPVGHDCR
jgi:transposase